MPHDTALQIVAEALLPLVLFEPLLQDHALADELLLHASGCGSGGSDLVFTGLFLYFVNLFSTSQLHQHVRRHGALQHMGEELRVPLCDYVMEGDAPHPMVEL